MWNLILNVKKESIEGSAIFEKIGRSILLNYLKMTEPQNEYNLHGYISDYYSNNIIYIENDHIQFLYDNKETLNMIGIKLIVEE